MACYFCEWCGDLIDDDWNPGEEYKDGLICPDCLTEHGDEIAEETKPVED